VGERAREGVSVSGIPKRGFQKNAFGTRFPSNQEARPEIPSQSAIKRPTNPTGWRPIGTEHILRRIRKCCYPTATPTAFPFRWAGSIFTLTRSVNVASENRIPFPLPRKISVSEEKRFYFTCRRRVLSLSISERVSGMASVWTGGWVSKPKRKVKKSRSLKSLSFNVRRRTKGLGVRESLFTKRREMLYWYVWETQREFVDSKSC